MVLLAVFLGLVIQLTIIWILIALYIDWIRISQNLEGFVSEYRENQARKQDEEKEKKERRGTNKNKILEDSETQTHADELEKNKDIEDEENEESNGLVVSQSVEYSVFGRLVGEVTNRKKDSIDRSLCEELCSSVNLENTENFSNSILSTFDIEGNSQGSQEAFQENFDLEKNIGMATETISSAISRPLSESYRQESTRESPDCDNKTVVAESEGNTKENIQENNISNKNIGGYIQCENFSIRGTQRKENCRWLSDGSLKCIKTTASAGFIDLSTISTPLREGNSQEKAEEGFGCKETSDSADCIIITKEIALEKNVSENSNLEGRTTFPIFSTPLGEGNGQENKEDGIDCNNTSPSAEYMAVSDDSIQEKCLSKDNDCEIIEVTPLEIDVSTSSISQGQGESQKGTDEGSYCNKTSASYTSRENIQENFKENMISENNNDEYIPNEWTYSTFPTTQNGDSYQEETRESLIYNMASVRPELISNVEKSVERNDVPKNTCNNGDVRNTERNFPTFPTSLRQDTKYENTAKGLDGNKTPDLEKCMAITTESAQEKIVSESNNDNINDTENAFLTFLTPKGDVNSNEVTKESPESNKKPPNLGCMITPNKNARENIYNYDELRTNENTVPNLREGKSQEKTEIGIDCEKVPAYVECTIINDKSVQENRFSENDNEEVIATEETFSTFPTQEEVGDCQENTAEGPLCSKFIAERSVHENSRESTEEGPYYFKIPASIDTTDISKERVQDKTNGEPNTAHSKIFTDMSYDCTSRYEVLQSDSENKDRLFPGVTVSESTPGKDAVEENADAFEENNQGYIHEEDVESVQEIDVPAEEPQLSDSKALDVSTEANKQGTEVTRSDSPGYNDDDVMGIRIRIAASHPDDRIHTVLVTPTMNTSDENCPANCRTSISPNGDGSTSLIIPGVDSSAEFCCQFGKENQCFYTDEGYDSLSSSDFGDSMPSLDSALSSLDSVIEKGSEYSTVAFQNGAYNQETIASPDFTGEEVKLNDDTGSGSNSLTTYKMHERGPDELTISFDQMMFNIAIHRKTPGSKREMIIFQMGMRNTLCTDSSDFLTEKFTCLVMHKGYIIVHCKGMRFCFLFARVKPSRQFTTKAERKNQASRNGIQLSSNKPGFVNSDLTTIHVTTCGTNGSGNGNTTLPKEEKDISQISIHKIKSTVFTYIAEGNSRKQFENTFCTGEMHFDETRCGSIHFSKAALPRPELYDSNITNEDNYFHLKSKARDYGKTELSRKTRQKRKAKPNKHKKRTRKRLKAANRSNNQVKQRRAFKKYPITGSSFCDDSIDLLSMHGHQKNAGSIHEKLQASTQTFASSVPYQQDKTKLYHKWLYKQAKYKGKTTGRKQRKLHHSDKFFKSCSSFRFLKCTTMRQVSTTGKYIKRKVLQRQILRKNCQLMEFVKHQVKYRYPKCGLWNRKLEIDSRLFRILAKRRHIYSKGMVCKPKRLKMTHATLGRVRRSKTTHELISNMNVHTVFLRCKSSFKELGYTEECQTQSEYTESRSRQATVNHIRQKIADGQMRTEYESCFNSQTNMFKETREWSSTEACLDELGNNEDILKESLYQQSEFEDINRRAFRGKSADDSSARLSQEDIQNILSANFSKVENDEYKALFKTVGAEHGFYSENGLFCLLKDFECWSRGQVIHIQKVLKRFVLEKVGPVEICPGVSILDEEDIDVEFFTVCLK